MKSFFQICVVAIVGANVFCDAFEVCGPGTNSDLQSETAAAYERAVEWLMIEQNERYGWDHDVTSRVVLSLQLTNQTWFNSHDLISQLNVKEMEIELLAKLSHANPRNDDSGSDSDEYDDDNGGNYRDPLSAGRLSYPIMALHSTCHDVTNFHGHDLIELLNRKIRKYPDGDFNQFFQYAWAVLALCTTNSDINSDYIEEIRQGQHEDGGFDLGTDVTAMVVTAMSCVKKNTDLLVDDILDKAVDKLLGSQKDDGQFRNINANALVVQALTAAGREPTSWHCETVMQHILKEQEVSGAFGVPVLTTFQVLPSLTGTSFADVSNAKCDDNNAGGEETTTVLVDNENAMVAMSLTVINDITGPGEIGTYQTTIMSGMNLYQAMLQIQDETNGEFNFVARDTAWGHSIQTIDGVSASVEAKLYWSIQNQDGRSNTGVDGFFPEDGDRVYFIYTSWA